ncbi:MAG: ATP synthase F0 subunit B [Myxococcales bacterium]|nr:ATP synthase F0 subunit B [Myxococcales bacterium]
MRSIFVAALRTPAHRLGLAVGIVSLLIAGVAIADETAPAPAAAQVRVGGIDVTEPPVVINPNRKVGTEPNTPAHAVAADPHGEAAHHGHHDPSQNFNWVTGGLFGYKKLDAAGGPLGDGKMGEGDHAEPLTGGEKETPMSAPFIFALVNFAILLWILGAKAWPVVQKLAADRSDGIKSALDEARVLREAAQAKLAEYDAKLAASAADMDKLVADMKADAENEKRRILAAADEQAAAMKKDVEQRIAAEITRARTELQREVAVAAAAAAETMLRSAASAGDQTALVAQFQKDLDAKLGASSGRPS